MLLQPGRVCCYTSTCRSYCLRQFSIIKPIVSQEYFIKMLLRKTLHDSIINTDPSVHGHQLQHQTQQLVYLSSKSSTAIKTSFLRKNGNVNGSL